MHFKHPETMPHLHPQCVENCLPRNWSLVPKRLETTAIEDIHPNDLGP